MRHQSLVCLLASAIILTPANPVHAQDLDRAVGALIGAIIGGAIQGQQRQRQQTTRQQPQRAQPARPTISQAQRQATREVQTALNFFDFPAGTADGVMGPNTRSAIRAYQSAMGYPVTGSLEAAQRDFLLGSYRRARNASADPRDRGILEQQGSQSLLRVYRDELRSSPAQIGQPQVGSAMPSMLPESLGAAQPPIGSQSGGVTELSLSAVRGDSLFGPHAVITAEQDTYRCLGAANNNAFSECLRDADVPEPAVRAAVALSRDGTNQYIVDYFEVGPIDIAVLQWPAAGQGITWGFVLDGAEFLAANDLFRPMDVHDGASRSLARRHPRAAAMNVTGIAGHRYLENGAQRFILTTPLTDGCRACDIVGTAIGHVDFRDGRVKDSGTIGWAVQSGPFSGDADDIRQRLAARDVREMQTQLNLRGYIAGAMDGAFGPNTARALQEFRREHCLGNDAEWTRETVGLLADLARIGHTFGEAATCGPRLPTGPQASNAVTNQIRQPRNVLPFEDGIYTVSQRYCDPETQATLGDSFGARVQIIEGRQILRGYEVSCEITSVVERGKLSDVTAGCMAEGDREVREWTIEPLSSTAFVERGGFLDGMRFELCTAPSVKPADGHEEEPFQRTDEIRTDQVALMSVSELSLARGFLDPVSAARYGKQPLGLELRADPNTPMLAPVSGIIMGKRSEPDVPKNEKWLLLRDQTTGQEHIFGGIESPLEPGQRIQAGDPLGEIVGGSDGNRIHWGINRLGVWQAVDTASGWGWDHGPATASAEQARARGWIDPSEHFSFRAAETAETPESSGSTAAVETPSNTSVTIPTERQDNQATDVKVEELNEESTTDELSLVEQYFTSALGVDSDYVQLQLIDAGFYSGDLAPFEPNGRHSQWTPKVQDAFQKALDYARAQGITYDLSNETGYYAFVSKVRAHHLDTASTMTSSE